jgi:hypothetical protein
MINLVIDRELAVVTRWQWPELAGADEPAEEPGLRWSEDYYMLVHNVTFGATLTQDCSDRKMANLHNYYTSLDYVTTPDGSTTYGALWSDAVAGMYNALTPTGRQSRGLSRAASGLVFASSRHLCRALLAWSTVEADIWYGRPLSAGEATLTGPLAREVEVISEAWIGPAFKLTPLLRSDERMPDYLQPTAEELKQLTGRQRRAQLRRGTWFLARPAQGDQNLLWFGRVQRLVLHEGPDGVARVLALTNKWHPSDAIDPVTRCPVISEEGMNHPVGPLCALDEMIPWPCWAQEHPDPDQQQHGLMVMMARHWHVLDSFPDGYPR